MFGAEGAINWNIFGAGISLIGFAITLFIGVAILGKVFNLDIKMPTIIPIVLFIFGLAVVSEAFGVMSWLYKFILVGIGGANLIELVVGIIILVIALYKPKLKEKLKGIPRILVGVFGAILTLDAVGIIPISDFISDLMSGSLASGNLMGASLASAQIFNGDWCIPGFPWIVLALIALIAIILIATQAFGGKKKKKEEKKKEERKERR